MALARLSVLVSATDDPCGVDDRTWYITIYNCDGNVLDWCNTRYVVMRAPCGYLEVDVPPGTYYLKAVWGYTNLGSGVYQVNHFTDAAIVTACCETTTCVKLFNPSVHRCGYIYVKALQDMAARGELEEEVVAQAARVVETVKQRGDFPGGLFEVGHDKEIEERVREQEG